MIKSTFCSVPWILSILGLLIMCAISSSAQTNQSGRYLSNKDADPKAKALLKQVKDQLKLDKGAVINFSFKYYPAEGSATTQKGKLQIKGKKFKLDLLDQELTSDGHTLWTYLKKRNEVQIQTALEIENDPFSPFRLLQIHDSPDFTYIMNGTSKENNVIYDIIEFKPLDNKAEFFKIKSEIDRTTKKYHKIVLYLKNGDQYALELGTQVSQSLPDKLFTWDKNLYPGIKLEDLR